MQVRILRNQTVPRMMTAATAVHPTMGVAKRTLVVQEAVLKTQAVLLKVPAEMIREALTKAVPEVEVPKEAAVAPVVPVKAALEAEVPKNPAVAPEIPAAVPKAQAAVRPRVQAAVRKIPETTRHKMPEEVLPAITVVPELEVLSL